MTNSVMPNSIPALRAALVCHERAIEYIRATLEILTTFDPTEDPRKYWGKKIAVALEEYLRERGGRADRSDCLKALLAGGCEMGERPKANLGTAITTNPQTFAVSGDRVMLTSAKKDMERAA